MPTETCAWVVSEPDLGKRGWGGNVPNGKFILVIIFVCAHFISGPSAQ